jgi:hypothetical protein
MGCCLLCFLGLGGRRPARIGWWLCGGCVHIGSSLLLLHIRCCCTRQTPPGRPSVLSRHAPCVLTLKAGAEVLRVGLWSRLCRPCKFERAAWRYVCCALCSSWALRGRHAVQQHAQLCKIFVLGGSAQRCVTAAHAHGLLMQCCICSMSNENCGGVCPSPQSAGADTGRQAGCVAADVPWLCRRRLWLLCVPRLAG